MEGGGSKVAVGFGLMGTGVLLVFGGITGRLAPMLAALFVPSALTSSSSSSDAFGGLGNALPFIAGLGGAAAGLAENAAPLLLIP